MGRGPRIRASSRQGRQGGEEDREEHGEARAELGGNLVPAFSEHFYCSRLSLAGTG